jgi:hypothetical protein
MSDGYLPIWISVTGLLAIVLGAIMAVNHARDRGSHRLAKILHCGVLVGLSGYAVLVFDVLRQLWNIGLPTSDLLSGDILTWVKIAYLAILATGCACILSAMLAIPLAARKRWARVVVVWTLGFMGITHSAWFMVIGLEFGFQGMLMDPLEALLAMLPVPLGIGGCLLYRSLLMRAFFGGKTSFTPEALDAIVMEERSSSE